jgi:hypothetical protein
MLSKALLISEFHSRVSSIATFTLMCTFFSVNLGCHRLGSVNTPQPPRGQFVQNIINISPKWLLQGDNTCTLCPFRPSMPECHSPPLLPHWRRVRNRNIFYFFKHAKRMNGERSPLYSSSAGRRDFSKHPFTIWWENDLSYFTSITPGHVLLVTACMTLQPSSESNSYDRKVLKMKTISSFLIVDINTMYRCC